MPWCEACAKFWSPNTLPADGTCPMCGRPVDAPEPVLGIDGDEDDYKAPWHFKLMMAMALLYLGWRLIQMFDWLI